MSKFTALDERLHAYMVDHGARQDDALRQVQDDTAAMGDIAVMQVAPDQGAFMTLLARAIGAREALEVGTFTGYSAICIARGLEPGGRLICCELSEEFAEVAAANFERAGVADRIEIRVGDAAEAIADIPEREVFDLTFIDADKPGYARYYELVLPRTRAGGLILFDNVFANGNIARPDGEVEEGWRDNVEALRKLNDDLAVDERIDLAMVGIADGLTIARKR
jgi:caffeoyl-CoA O-methyltransferase